MTSDSLTAWMVEWLAKELSLSPHEIDPDVSFSLLGIDSASALGLVGDLETHLGREISPTLLFEHPSVAELAARLTGNAKPVSVQRKRAAPEASEPIAIVGMACRFPGASDLNDFWDLLENGRDAIVEIPPERLDIASIYDQDPGPGRVATRWAGLLQDVRGFDAPFFGISPHEAERMDPQQRILMEVSWEALEDAGIVASSIRGSNAGVFIGISANEYAQLHGRRLDQIDGHSGTGNALSIAANRLSFEYDLRGPSLAVDTACSSSLVALHLACRSLRQGESSLALVGGVNLLLSRELFVSFSSAGMMAADGRCKTFDARADGYVRGEGCGVIVLKPLSAALESGDRIVALVHGSAVGQDGRSNGLTAPNPAAQQQVIVDACQDAGFEPSEIDYVEAHGTGTFLGDPIEATALGRAIAQGREKRCLVGSVKTNVGHLEAAAGIAGVIKTALALERGAVPPNLHFETPNQHIPFEDLRLEVVQKLTPWPTDSALAGVSSFGFGGTNAHVILGRRESTRPDDGSSLPSDPASPTSDAAAGTSELHLLPVSARSSSALEKIAGRFSEHLRRSGPASAEQLPIVAYNAGARRTHHRYRLAWIGNDLPSAARSLGEVARGANPTDVLRSSRAGRRPRAAFVFSGHGSQWPGMGRDLLAAEPAFAHVLTRCDGFFRELSSLSVVEELSRESSSSRLGETSVLQPVLFSLQVALAELWRSWGIAPKAVLGHSLGEIAAAHVAGALSLLDACRLAWNRGRCMQRTAGKGKMLAARVTRSQAEELVATSGNAIELAAENGPDSFVFSGAAEPLGEIARHLEQSQVAFAWVPVDHAFHSAQMDEVLEEFERSIQEIAPREVRIPFYSTVTGQVHSADLLGPAYWVRNIRESVRFRQAVESVGRDGFDTLVELGGHPVLAADAKRTLSGISGLDPIVVASLRRGEPERTVLLRALGELYVGGFDPEWSQVYATPQDPVALPGYAWDHTAYWLDVDESAESPKQLHAKLGDGADPLLGARIALPGISGSKVFETIIEGEGPTWLQDHRVRGLVVLPAASFLEILATAAQQLDTGDSVVLDDVRLHNAAVLVDGHSLRLRTSIEEDGSGGFAASIWSAGANASSDPESWTHHVSARIRRESGSFATPSVDLPGVLSRCFDRLPISDFYAALRHAGLEYGPAFRRVDDLWRRDGEALGRLKAIDEDPEAGDVSSMLLDAAFHVVAAAVLGASALNEVPPLLVPTHCRRFRANLPLRASLGDSKLRVHAVIVDEPGANESGIVADVRIADEDGRVAIEIEGLVLTPIDKVQHQSQSAERAWCYGTEWRPLKTPAAQSVDAGMHWLIFATDGALGTALVAQLEERGVVVTTVRPGSNFLQEAERCYRIDSSNSEHVDRLLADVYEAEKQPLHGVVHMYNTDPATGELAGVLRALELGPGLLLDLVQGLSKRAPFGIPRLRIVTRGAHVLDDGAAAVEHAPLWGMGRAISLEHPELRCKRIDLDPEPGATEAASLADEVLADDDEGEVAVRHNERFVPRLVAAEVPLDAGGPPVRPEASYLVAGGTGALGMMTAQWLVEHGARHLVLVSRRGGGASSQLAVDTLRERGVEVWVEALDIADPHETATLLERIREKLPPLAGVIHAAGLLDDDRLLRLTRRRLYDVMAAKTAGAWNLDRLTQGDSLDFFVLFSSAASVLGSPGQSNYCAANAFLDALALARQQRGESALVVNWGPWAEIGMAAEDTGQLATGLTALEPNHALRLLEGLMSGSATQRVVVSFDLSNLVQFYPAGAQATFFEELMGSDLGVIRSSGVKARLYDRPELPQEYVAPRDETETLIAGIWQRSLGIKQVGIHDSFFELGGDSIFAANMIIQIESLFGVSVDAEKAFETFTVEHLANMVRERLEAIVEEMSEAEVERLLGGDGRSS